MCYLHLQETCTQTIATLKLYLAIIINYFVLISYSYSYFALAFSGGTVLYRQQENTLEFYIVVIFKAVIIADHSRSTTYSRSVYRYWSH